MAKKMWGGRFTKKTDPLVEEFTRSIDYDYKLLGYDILGSMVHVQILKKAKLVTTSEEKKLLSALEKAERVIEENGFDRHCEDIHTNVQNLVEKEAGEVALKLHTARSRNDQVLFDTKLFSIVELVNVEELCLELVNALEEACVDVEGIVIPGYTHLQQAQLLLLSDYLASYVEMLERDSRRLYNTRNNIRLYLGAGALAGTPIHSGHYNAAVKRFLLEKMPDKAGKLVNIKHIGAASNSLDAVSDRDFVIETLSALSILGMHLSRLSEDLIIWSTKEFGFVEMDDAFATGSSLMPQKKNPDVLELVRGFTGTLYGNLMGVLTMMKGLPLTYNRDMQLDKPPLFNSFDIVTKELKVLTKLIGSLKWNKDLIEDAIEDSETLYATDLVYHLCDKGISFKQAHDIVGRLVKESLSGKKIRDMTDKELSRFSDKLRHSEVVKLMNPVKSVKSRVSVDRLKKLKT